MLATVLGLTGGLAAAIIGAWAALRARRPPKSQVELVDVTIAPPSGSASGPRDMSPVLDVKVRNTGGQSAVLKRLVVRVHRAVRCGSMFSGMRLTPYSAMWVGALLPVSATYDAAIPPPEDAGGSRAVIDLSQVVAQGEADRFEVRLGMQPTFDTYVYELDLEIIYDGNDRMMTSPRVAVAFPQHGFVYSADEIRTVISHFLEDTREVREAIDREMTERGLPVPDWESAPPRRRADLPDGLVSVDGNADILSSGAQGIYEVTEAFWDPRRAITGHLRSFERMYRQLVEITVGAAVADEVLTASLPLAEATLAQLPALYAEFRVPTTAEVERVGEPAGTKQPAKLMAEILDRHSESAARASAFEELRSRIRARDEGTFWFLGQLLAEEGRRNSWLAHIGLGTMPNGSSAAELLDEFLRLRSPDDRDSFNVRRDLANRRGSRDAASAAAALGTLLDDQSRALGREHPDTCATRIEVFQFLMEAGDMAAAATVAADIVADQRRTVGPDHRHTFLYRHNLGFCLGEAGDHQGAVDVFTELLGDAMRVLGPDTPNTLDVRHELARWRGRAGDAAGAAAEFAEIVPDRIRIQGPDHPHTLMSRHNLALWTGEAGDSTGAAAAFAELVVDRRRVLGPEHPDTLKSERALAHWREQPGPHSPTVQ
ncbi:tetratricopeptide repeat protein [Streptomyces sp. PSKA54]|uniref:Tetratricopeptide repeat protein n=1 Tax=Streptomyces himalayensis subsp. aureolus TaxID=2758039 RepID=A0A7W2D7Z6_9ACTN|nr:tetratricopeptide repeat protein [Streptomyces himalayensis]MBA4866472.1 tetratricopeptide repeat protein [Streptomyces himalayensis subsp. aureolus]